VRFLSRSRLLSDEEVAELEPRRVW
jgi:hypothetical protein